MFEKRGSPDCITGSNFLKNNFLIGSACDGNDIVVEKIKRMCRGIPVWLFKDSLLLLGFVDPRAILHGTALGF